MAIGEQFEISAREKKFRWWTKSSLWDVACDQVNDVGRSLIVKSFERKDDDFKLYAIYNWQPMKVDKYI